MTCHRCGIRAPRTIPPYWDRSIELCVTCARIIHDEHDRNNTWPKEAT